MSENYRIDNLDQAILSALMENARLPYAELAKQLLVSPGTIHVRVEKKRRASSRNVVQVNPKKLGYDVCRFIGINLKSARITRRPWPNCRRWTRWWRPTTPRATTASS